MDSLMVCVLGLIIIAAVVRILFLKQPSDQLIWYFSVCVPLFVLFLFLKFGSG